MEEFINSFGRNNLIVVVAIVFAIVLALVMIVLIEKIKLRKRQKEEYFEEELLEDNPSDIVYEEEKSKEKKEEYAKQTLENITKKLIEQEENNSLITKTTFEVEQEERSVISYEELLKASHDVDNTNDALLKDEGTEPITIEELYKKHLEETNIKETLDNPIFEEQEDKEKKEIKKEKVEEEPKKFKNSEIISPVFGIYNAKKSKQNDDYLEKTMDLEDLELEIKKTEEFLNELKELKEKLN